MPKDIAGIELQILTGIKTGGITVTTTATPLRTLYPTNQYVAIMIQNNGSATIYIGGSDVTAGNGFPLGAGDTAKFFLAAEVQIYGIAASGTVATRILEGM